MKILCDQYNDWLIVTHILQNDGMTVASTWIPFHKVIEKFSAAESTLLRYNDMACDSKFETATVSIQVRYYNQMNG